MFNDILIIMKIIKNIVIKKRENNVLLKNSMNSLNFFVQIKTQGYSMLDEKGRKSAAIIQ